ncbi:Stk1 family PASTA domain-containing Ser/Thr kinase [Ligilactobacillus murinus]|uniref:Stk1 family PASTA domain-containing Ser/Thr kinase n=1 Tax=Ligilactobacillus murinus TaxID=1622 RepID=UPI003519D21F
MRAGYAINGRYRIIRSLGEGGMANVYLAYDLILEREVAVKLLRLDLSDDKAAIRRFQREANSLIELDDPHIVDIFDVGEDHGMQYLVMEYVKGMDLKRYIEKYKPLAYAKVIEIMEQILSAVKEAHSHGIIHRDLKPQNILLDEAGNVKITDFGIAIALAEETMTKTNTLMGSVHYISPEQARGSMITQQSDIYSLGIILFEMLTGRVPYDGETAVSIALKHYRSQMPAPRSFKQDIPQALENIVLHATAKDCTDRYQNVEEMQADLATCLDEKRAAEQQWRPRTHVEEETKILPNFYDEVAREDKNLTKTIQITPEPKKAVKKTPKRLKIWLLMILSILVVLGALIYTLPKDVSVPDLKGMHKKEAVQLLESQRLSLGKVTYQYDARYDAGCVTFTSPSKGTTVKQRTKIDLILSKGLPKKAFGDYRGRDFSDVKRKLKAQGVTVKQEKQYSDSVASGEIIAQSISPKKKVAFAKTTVTFTVSQGQNFEGMIDLTGYTLSEAKEYARECGLELVVKKASSSKKKATFVIAQEPAVGTPLHEGDVLEITLGRKNENIPYNYEVE